MHSQLANRLKGRLIVSCQAPAGDPFAAPELLALFAKAAVDGGAAGIRTDGPDCVRATKRVVNVPIVAIRKRMQPDGRIMITPSNEDAAELVAAGADIVAVDCTARGRERGALERVAWIQTHLGVPVWADVATVDEGVAAAGAGAAAVLSTLRGYTPDTAHVRTFDAGFIAELVRTLTVPVIAEGWVATPEEAAGALSAGAFAVVVGTAITRPQEITRRFAARMS
jgi:putative N-acetylmannosamine-6-phosphate epimerase